MQFDPVFLSRSEPAIVTSLSRTSAKPLSLQEDFETADPDPATEFRWAIGRYECEPQTARPINLSVGVELMSKTIMLVHGAWVTTDCWTSFREFLEAKGHRVVVPEWPYLDRPVEELRRSPDPGLAKMTIKGLVDHFEKQIRDLPQQPVLIGHSFGGLIVQMLLDRGLGAAGVAIDPAPPRGVLPSVTAIRSALPVLLTWRGWSRMVSMSFKSFSRRSPSPCRKPNSAGL